MPHLVAFSEVAELHLQEIEAYLAERFYPANAERFVQRLTSTCLALGAAPYRGTKRDDLAPGYEQQDLNVAPRSISRLSTSGYISSVSIMGDGSSRWNFDG